MTTVVGGSGGAAPDAASSGGALSAMFAGGQPRQVSNRNTVRPHPKILLDRDGVSIVHRRHVGSVDRVEIAA
jgi:hypothetical protein